MAWPYSREYLASVIPEGATVRRLRPGDYVVVGTGKLNAITVGAEYEFWREAGWVEDVTIRNNTIEDVGRDGAMHNSGAYVLGAISVFGRTDQRSQLPLWPGNRDIVIEGNTIRDCPAAGIFVAAAKEVRVRGNRLKNCFHWPGKSAGKARKLDVRGSTDARHTQNVTIERNETKDAN